MPRNSSSCQSNHCKPQQIEAYLSDRLTRIEEEELLQHLDECNACCQQIEETAAERETWQAMQTHLRDDGFDSHPLADEPLVTSDSPIVSQQISFMLTQLAPTDDPNMLGRLGGYEISGVIGAGGMGIVLKGYDTALDRVVALKVLAPHLASSGAARKRFAREAKAAAAVLHPNVIAIHSVSNDAQLPFLVMPYVRGNSLQRRLDQRGPHPIREVLRVGCQVAAGLAAAHAQGLVHRDIKPANVLLEEGIERVTITDFGLARAVDDATLTRSGVIAGTPQYMSPEQATGEPIDGRSDLFSLGSVLYAMCTGHAPFRSNTTFGVLRRITDSPARPIREGNPEIPDWLGRLVERLHEKNPADRLQSAAEAEALMQHCLAHLELPRQNPLPNCLLPRKRTWLPAAMAASLLLLAMVAGRLVMWPSGLGVEPNSPQSLSTATPATPSPPNANLAVSWDDEIAETLQETARSIARLQRELSTP
ncbi:serine/threonine-protein kinase [Aureliella helgolandensis]|uniref:non-specific serine/threonine protein kinase n=1 Tax=Aureliella helgolandensis TaxID=2527968 RepID=A0A518G9B8_9BACT|nr:serine/threonine-protein kinase [Aureliella helgolandensis]QDV25181.1 Serine/threonine-protein kinase PrkC [Aureliella helgolandensis]